MKAGEHDLLTATEAAAVLGITPTYLCRLKKMGKISSVGQHRGVRYRRSDIEAFQQHQHPPDLLTTTAAAAFLGLTPSYLRQLKQAGKITPVERQRGQGQEDLYQRADLNALPLGHRPPLLSAFRDTPAFRARVGFRDALKQALEHSGLTLEDATKASGLKVNVVYGWIAGRWKPFRDDLGRLAQTVQEPRLVDLIESRWRTITVSCRECGNSRTFSTGRLRSYVNTDGSNYTVDWEKGIAEHTCRRCNILAPQRRIIKRKGRKGLRDMARHLVKWGQDNPEERRSHIQHASEVRLLNPIRGQTSARFRLSKILLQPPGAFSLCVMCHRLIFTSAASERARQQQDVHHIGKFHKPCLLTWKKSEPMRAWSSEMKRSRRLGKPVPPALLPQLPAGRPVTEAALRDAYETTVRYFRLQVQSRLADRDGNGEIESQAGLAKKLNLSRQGLQNRVRRFLALLPDEMIATGSVKAWRDMFLELGADLINKT